jgi:hypothetical protein
VHFNMICTAAIYIRAHQCSHHTCRYADHSAYEFAVEVTGKDTYQGLQTASDLLWMAPWSSTHAQCMFQTE